MASDIRFQITEHSSGYYQVSRPDYGGGAVVDAASYDKVIGDAERLRQLLQHVHEAG